MDKWKEFIRLYEKYYLDGYGPSVSSACDEKANINCGCWQCLYQKLKEKND